MQDKVKEHEVVATLVSDVTAALAIVLPPQEQRIWLRAPNPRLNGSPPIDLLLNGGAEEVEAALRA